MSRLLIVALLIVAVAYAVEDMRCGEDSRGKCFSPFLQLFDILDAYSGNPIPKGTPGKTLLSFSNDLAPSAKFRMCHNGPKVGCDGNDFIDCAALNVTWHPERIPMGDTSPTLWTPDCQCSIDSCLESAGMANTAPRPCLFTLTQSHIHTITHSLSLVLVVMI